MPSALVDRTPFVLLLTGPAGAPSLQTVLERNRKRLGDRPLRDETVRTIHAAMAAWRGEDVPIVDNSALTVEQTVRAIDRTLRSHSFERLPSPP